MKKDDDSSVSIKQILITAMFICFITFGGLNVYRIGYEEKENTIHTIESASQRAEEYEVALVENTEEDVVYLENVKFMSAKVVEIDTQGAYEEVQNELEHVKEVQSEILKEKNDTNYSEKVVSRGNLVREPYSGDKKEAEIIIQNEVGAPTEYVKTIDVKATAYCLCKKCCGKSTSHPAYGITASGLKITPGIDMKVVASDPTVIPLGTKVYIEGLYGANDYGYAVVADTGSAIKNLKIDLYMDTHQMALNWGVKSVRVYILDK